MNKVEHLFGTSGIRRRISDLPDSFCMDLGLSIGSFYKGTIAVGRDTRASGPALEKRFIEGVTQAGSDVVRLGVASTPTVGVAASKYGLGVVVTASHNPPEYNGFKFFDRHGAISSDDERVIGELMSSKDFRKGAGVVSNVDFIKKHISIISDVVGEADGVKVFLDCAGGAGSTVTPLLLERLGAKASIINDRRDGMFPHPLEPTEKNLVDTCRACKKSGVDIGFAHDGDADRTCAISSDGKLIEWDSFLTALASGSKKVVTTVDASMRIEEFCNKVYRVPVGDVAVSKGIREHKAGFGGEPSGTYIFPDIHIFPDGVAAVAKATKMVAESRFYELIREIPSYPMSRLKIPCDPGKKDLTMEGVKKAVKGFDYTDIDGVRISFDAGWVLIRPSGTEDYVRITAEAMDEHELERIVSMAKKWVKSEAVH